MGTIASFFRKMQAGESLPANTLALQRYLGKKHQLTGWKDRGRPPGSTTYSPDEFAARLPEAFEAVKARTGKKPTRDQVAAEIPVSPRTFRRYLNEHVERGYPSPF